MHILCGSYRLISTRNWSSFHLFVIFLLQEEWDLMFSYLLSYPSMLQSSVRNVEQGKVAPHLVCSFIMAMCSCFSAYYRRIRILTVCIHNDCYGTYVLFFSLNFHLVNATFWCCLINSLKWVGWNSGLAKEFIKISSLVMRWHSMKIPLSILRTIWLKGNVNLA